MQNTSDQLRSSATISDLQLVQAIAKLRKKAPHGYYWVMIWELAAELDIHPNRVRSKVRRARKRNLVDGCICGCRGDFELLPAGEKMLRDEQWRRLIYILIN